MKDLYLGLNAVEVIWNPYFIACFAMLCIFTLLRRMIRLIVVFVAAVGIVLLCHYTIPQGSGADLIQAPSLLKLAGGALAICALLVYFFFVRQD
ncbi:MAG: hypothetical protein V2A77_07515 [Pseudomonadota bacterium]